MYRDIDLAFTDHALAPHYSLLLSVSEHYSHDESKFYTVSQTQKIVVCLFLAEQVCDTPQEGQM